MFLEMSEIAHQEKGDPPGRGGAAERYPAEIRSRGEPLAMRRGRFRCVRCVGLGCERVRGAYPSAQADKRPSGRSGGAKIAGAGLPALGRLNIRMQFLCSCPEGPLEAGASCRCLPRRSEAYGGSPKATGTHRCSRRRSDPYGGNPKHTAASEDYGAAPIVTMALRCLRWPSEDYGGPPMLTVRLRSLRWESEAYGGTPMLTAALRSLQCRSDPYGAAPIVTAARRCLRWPSDRYGANPMLTVALRRLRRPTDAYGAAPILTVGIRSLRRRSDAYGAAPMLTAWRRKRPRKLNALSELELTPW